MRRVSPGNIEHLSLLGDQGFGPGFHQPGSGDSVGSSGGCCGGLPLCWPSRRCPGTQKGPADQQCMAPGWHSLVCSCPWWLLGTSSRHATFIKFLISKLINVLQYYFLEPGTELQCLCCHAGRALAGVGAGAASLYVPRYISEVAPISIRGALATLNQVCPLSSVLQLPYPHLSGCAPYNIALTQAIQVMLTSYMMCRPSSAWGFWWRT